jgi:hypothetical protein
MHSECLISFGNAFGSVKHGIQCQTVPVVGPIIEAQLNIRAIMHLTCGQFYHFKKSLEPLPFGS